MKIYTKTFVNPLLAIAFKDGMEFVGDPDYKCMEPKQEGNKWSVIIEHDDGDDEDEDDAIVIHVSEPDEPVLPMNSLKDYEAKFNKMKPKSVTEKEVIHPPVKIDDSKKKTPDRARMTPRYLKPAEAIIHAGKTADTSDEPEPLPPIPSGRCFKCVPCSQGQECIEIIAEACKNMPGFRSER